MDNFFDNDIELLDNYSIMKKLNKKILIYIVVGVLVLTCIYLGYTYGKKGSPFSQGKWQVVQLINGDVYYGHLKTFHGYELSNVYYIQNIQTGTTTSPQLLPLNSLFFGPENTMQLNKNQVMWSADLNENSQILNAIKQIETGI